MAKKKLQIFISSTYTDLIEERQAAVEAILGSKHITAGMELFRAGNTSQLDTIKRWIDESDIYMLILGGRYGSIEPSSGKSYTHIEYEYALDKGIPVFAVILNDKFLHQKQALYSYDVFEKDNKDKYLEFKKLVESKIIKYVDDCKDIKIAIKDSISELEEEYELVGWVRSNEGDTGQLLKQLNDTRLECDKLRSELEEYKNQLATNDIAATLSSGQEKTRIKYLNLESSQGTYFIELTWNKIFIFLGNGIYSKGSITNDEIKKKIVNEIERVDKGYFIDVEESEIIRILVQLEKLNLIKRNVGRPGFTFTQHGQEEFYNQLTEKNN